MPTTEELQRQLTAAQERSEALRQAAETETDLDALVDLQGRLTASETIVGRISGQLRQQQDAEHEAKRREDERRERERLDAELERLSKEHSEAKGRCSALLNGLAEAVAQTVLDLQSEEPHLRPVAAEHAKLFQERWGRAPERGEHLGSAHWRVPDEVKDGSEYQPVAKYAVLTVSEMILERASYELAAARVNGSLFRNPPKSAEQRASNVSAVRERARRAVMERSES